MPGRAPVGSDAVALLSNPRSRVVAGAVVVTVVTLVGVAAFFGLRGIGGIGVGMDDAKLVQCERLVPARLLPPGQVDRLACMLPGLLAAPRQTPDLAEPCDSIGITLQRARVDIFTDRLLQQRTPLRETPLERISRA